MSAGRTSALLVVLAVLLLGLAGWTDEGSGASWGDGTQAIANLSWIGMIVAAAAALAFGVRALVHRRHLTHG